ncbi:MAG: DUF3373 family protein [Desulfobacteraceae bacterium]|nr:MAG: DUF3373 family protein [Desulfobacteraceae bacterium]
MNFLNRCNCFLFFLCLLFSATVSVAEENYPVHPSQTNQLQNQVDDLNNQLDIRAMEADGLKSAIKDQQEQIDMLKTNIASVYKQTISDAGVIEKYKLGNSVYLQTSYYDLVRENNMTDEKHSDNAFTNLLDLKFSGQPTNEIQFHTTLSMYKLWGTWNTPADVMSSDFSYSGKPSDSGVKVKRGYVDYRPDWLDQYVNLTFGRLPTSDGYLTSYRYNRPVQTSYPDLGFSAESDGIGLTFYFENPVAKSINLIYARSEDDTDAYPFQKDQYGLDDIDFYAVQANGELPMGSDSTALSFQWLRVDNIRPTGDDQIRDMIAYYKLPIQSISFPDQLGCLDKLTFQMDNNRVFDSPVDFFASVAWSSTNTSKDQVMVNGQPFDPSILPADLQKYTRYLYLLSPDNQESHDGYAVYAGLRYNFEIDALRNPKLGFEYFTGSEYWVGLNVSATDPYQKLNTRGDVWEVYWIQPFVEKMLQMRTGYQVIQRDYTESLLAGLYGPADTTDEDDTLFYMSLDFIF